MTDVKGALAAPRYPLYAVFVHFKTVFELLPRDEVTLTLVELDVTLNRLNFLAPILRNNRMTVNNAVAKLPPYAQRLGGQLKPVFFFILLKSLSDQTRGRKKVSRSHLVCRQCGDIQIE